MSSGMNLVIYPVSDLAGSTALYTKLLGVGSYLEQPYYVAFRVGDFELGLDPNGHKQGTDGPRGLRHPAARRRHDRRACGPEHQAAGT